LSILALNSVFEVGNFWQSCLVQNKVLVNIYQSFVSKPCCYPNGGGYKIKTQRICKKSEILLCRS
jgi:hypothetical protein